jgi:hypothetical protein
MYIDYNQDGNFTHSDETVVSRFITEHSLTNSSFTVPARSGSTRLRVVMSYDAATTSCGSFRNGETEDYTLIITGGAARTSARLATTDYGVYPSPATNVLTIRVPANHDAARLKYVCVTCVVPSSHKRYSGEGNLDVSGLSKGVYLLTITDGQQVSRQRFVKE